ncbi:hypothetical protein PAPYR_12251 [Paratrimastix pyriformis]|uniref:Uncharacterized protein n=1 Tax=Paratrimastix pyriformis TaxID=342808 RepID=A0ABQ8U253_9EUKA|nr:hypothetical protein PAPYR_12251 [Paratrimastix pyriformis]
MFATADPPALLPTPGWRFPAHFPSMQPGPRPGDRVPLPQQPRRLPTSSGGDRESGRGMRHGPVTSSRSLPPPATVTVNDIVRTIAVGPRSADGAALPAGEDARPQYSTAPTAGIIFHVPCPHTQG